MRTALSLAVAVSLLAGAAAAQTATPAPAEPKARTANTVGGVTVTPIPRKSCSSRDRDCVALVVAELKEFYPEQLRAFCFQWQTQAARTQFVYDQMQPLDPLNPTPPAAFGVNAAVKTACTTNHGQPPATTPPASAAEMNK